MLYLVAATYEQRRAAARALIAVFATLLADAVLLRLTGADVVPDSGSRRFAYLQFDLSSCSVTTTGGADSATLSVFLANAPKGTLTVAASRVTSAWSNSTTWASQPATATATDSKASGTTNGVLLTFTVTGDVDDFIKGGATNFGWRLTESGTVQNAAKDLTQFSSADAAANKPQLVINYEK